MQKFERVAVIAKPQGAISRYVRELTDLITRTGCTPYLDENDRLITEAVMVQVGIYHKRDSYLSQLSDGERQKAFIAKALAQESGRYVHRRPQLGRTSGLGYHLPDDQRKEKHGATVTGRMGRRPTRGTKEEKEMVVLTSIPFSFRTLYIKKVSILIIKMVLTEITTASVPGF